MIKLLKNFFYSPHDLEKFYNDRVNSFESNEHLKQVGHTLGGEEINQSDFQYLIDDISKILDLSENDKLLDLCCGNGIITKQLSKNCHSVSGIDISNEMISIASTNHLSNNITYIHSNIWKMDKVLNTKKDFTKVLMYGALQHFKEQDFDKLLQLIYPHCNGNVKILLGFIPDASKKWYFYDSFMKKVKYFYRTITNSDYMGTWWHRSHVEKICNKNALTCRFIDIKKGQYGHSYRFHILIKSKKI